MTFAEIQPEALKLFKTNQQSVLFLEPINGDDCVIDNTLIYLYVRKGNVRLVVGSVLVGETHQTAYQTGANDLSVQIAQSRSTIVLELYRLMVFRNKIAKNAGESECGHAEFTKYLDDIDWQHTTQACFINDVRMFDAPKLLDMKVVKSAGNICFARAKVF